MVAPGAVITTTSFDGLTADTAGTSVASPHAVGVAVLVRQALPGLTPDDIEHRLKAAGPLVTDDFNDADPATLRTTPLLDARVALLTNDATDSDLDGCTNGQEFQSATGSQASGGLRNPLHFWDFFDVWTGSPLARDRAVTITDIGGVVARFGASVLIPPIDPSAALTPPPPAPAYHAAFDRGGPFPGVDVWHLQPPDGSILLPDISAVAAQFGHVCGT